MLSCDRSKTNTEPLKIVAEAALPVLDTAQAPAVVQSAAGKSILRSVPVRQKNRKSTARRGTQCLRHMSKLFANAEEGQIADQELTLPKLPNPLRKRKRRNNQPEIQVCGVGNLPTTRMQLRSASIIIEGSHKPTANDNRALHLTYATRSKSSFSKEDVKRARNGGPIAMSTVNYMVRLIKLHFATTINADRDDGIEGFMGANDIVTPSSEAHSCLVFPTEAASGSDKKTGHFVTIFKPLRDDTVYVYDSLGWHVSDYAAKFIRLYYPGAEFIQRVNVQKQSGNMCGLYAVVFLHQALLNASAEAPFSSTFEESNLKEWFARCLEHKKYIVPDFIKNAAPPLSKRTNVEPRWGTIEDFCK